MTRLTVSTDAACRQAPHGGRNGTRTLKQLGLSKSASTDKRPSKTLGKHQRLLDEIEDTAVAARADHTLATERFQAGMRPVG